MIYSCKVRVDTPTYVLIIPLKYNKKTLASTFNHEITCAYFIRRKR